uniref:FUN14 domain-containing protein 2 n=1 Tax=Nothobranchius furzeri TaxID=105023 RepID=A0A8C6LCT5_NOTFU
MADYNKELGEEIYDKVVDLTQYAKQQRWWSRVFGKNSGPVAEKYSVASQIAIGGVSGWCAGYLFQKVGKVAATAVGGGLLLLQIANNSGYIQVDWKRVEKDVNKAKKQIQKGTNQAAPELNTFVEKVSSYFIKKKLKSICRDQGWTGTKIQPGHFDWRPAHHLFFFGKDIKPYAVSDTHQRTLSYW